MRPHLVVVRSPLIDSHASLSEIPEPIQVQALISEFPVEAFDEGILSRLARLDEVQLDARPLAPEEHRLAGKLRAIITDDRPRQASTYGELIEAACDLQAGDRHINDLAHALAGVVVHDIEDPYSPAGRQLVADEVHRPALVDPAENRHRYPGPGELLAPLRPYLQALLAIEAVGALV